MEKTPVKSSPTRPQRRALALVTSLFILASAVLHLLLGSTIKATSPHREGSQTAMPISIEMRRRPTPTPTPTPRATPTPQARKPIATFAPATRRPALARVTVRPIQPISLPTTRGKAEKSSDRNSAPPPAIAPAPQVQSTPLDARYIIVSARFIHRVQPGYPLIAADDGEEGTVIVLLTIGPDGVSDVRVWESSGYVALDQAALRAAKQSTYSLPEVNGEPATETYRVIYTFSLG